MLYDYLSTVRAKSRASQFCDGIALNASIDIVLKRATDEGISHLSKDWYSFYFPTAFFDTAICEVKTDRQGLVKSKNVWVSHD